MRGFVIAAVCAAGLFAGCGTHKAVTGRSVSDSVRVETRYRTEYRTDTVTVEVPVEKYAQVKADSSHLETDYAVSDALLRTDGKLYHSLENKAGKRPVEAKTRVEYRDSVVYRDRVRDEVRTVEVERPLSWWQRLQMTGFWVLFAFFAGSVCYKARKFIKNHRL